MNDDDIDRDFKLNQYQAGDFVLVVGLKKKPHYNDLIGRIIEWIDETQRFRTGMDSLGREISIKPSNLKMFHPKKYRNHSNQMRECTNCQGLMELSAMIECYDCRSVFYCSHHCQNMNSLRHSLFCQQYKDFMMLEYPLISEMDRLFKFDNVLLCNGQLPKKHEFLQKMQLYHQGIWYRFWSSTQTKFGELHPSFTYKDGWMPSALSEPLQLSEPIKGWKEYCQLRNVSLESPMMHWMSYIMTVYHALTNYVDISNEREVVIHMVGVELELDLLPLFEELLRLLPGHTFYFYLFGNNQKVSDKYLMGDRLVLKLKEENQDFIEMNILKDTYQRNVIGRWIEREAHLTPNIVIGLNAGFSAAEYGHCWTCAMQYITEFRLPALFTDYFNHSIMVNEPRMRFMHGGDMDVKYVVNPFRSPIVGFMDVMRFSSIANGFIWGVNI